MPKRIEFWANGKLIGSIPFRPEYVDSDFVRRNNDRWRRLGIAYRAIWA